MKKRGNGAPLPSTNRSVFNFLWQLKNLQNFFGNDLQLCTAVHGRRIIDTIFVKIGTFNAEYLVIKTVKQPGSCGEI